jgi:hypothetical protein
VRAQLTFEIYVERLAATIASLAPILQGLDILVFAGGVAENSDQLRSATCEHLGFLGVQVYAGKTYQAAKTVTSLLPMLQLVRSSFTQRKIWRVIAQPFLIEAWQAVVEPLDKSGRFV